MCCRAQAHETICVEELHVLSWDLCRQCLGVCRDVHELGAQSMFWLPRSV